MPFLEIQIHSIVENFRGKKFRVKVYETESRTVTPVLEGDSDTEYDRKFVKWETVRIPPDSPPGARRAAFGETLRRAIDRKETALTLAGAILE